MNTLKRLPNPFTREFWIEDKDVRQAVGPLPTRDRVHQARLSAIALERDREQLRADLMRKLRENREEHDRLHGALDELEVLMTLERAS